MATNTGDNYRIGSVKDRVQVCDIETKICYKIDTTTGEVIAVKDGDFKGVAHHTDNRRNDIFNQNIDKKLGE